MASLCEKIRSISPESGYHIFGTAWLAYGHRELGGKGSHRKINVQIRGEDALLLARAESDLAAATMIANCYNGRPVDYAQPSWGICSLDSWDLTIEAA
jgi:hypothetical protein